ncbi:hypothetical protein GCM10025881_17090 [Pseudolysinimonas kribbensis]|uniref:Amine oxidase n=1 Tax=Pseudolysinimonas kribbensis TaxID=433641 RepID=A0ABQ6K7C7_9MICO|nr:tyramine oxidase [Pseudolysinimonas kribbensis]GMA94885.1 hypothetical protein GCM10025881_17090 [Pseudolysinimonas kribbensis]
MTPTHPLSPLSAAEIDRAREVLAAAGYVSDATRFGYVMLREPDKADVLAGTAELPREVGALLLDVETGAVVETITDVTSGTVVRARPLGTHEGTAPVLDEEIELLDEIVKADADFVAALARRGVTDLSKVRTLPLTAGVFGYDDEVGKRMFRVLALYMEDERDIPWAHPIDGVVAHVDVISKRCLRVIETAFEHIPQESGDYLDPALTGPMRTDLKPISITQPEGVSFTLEDDVLSWQNWRVRVGFNGREGLTLHQVSFTDRGDERSVLYRASISEMVVNYADPSPTHGWNNYFDAGEYQFGRLANSLELGCDCLGEITYLDAVIADDFGTPQTIRNAICIHEEDYGILWKHTDEFTLTSATRRQRRLVVSFFTTVGNYDYGFYFYFYLDGTFEVEAKATGIVFVGAHDGGDYPYATELAPGLGAPVHQHLFCARLDMTVDGIRNAVDEVDITRVELGDDNPWGAAIARTATRLRTETEGCGMPTAPWAGCGASAAPSAPIVSGIPPRTCCTRRARRRSRTTPSRSRASAPASRATTSGSPATSATSCGPRATPSTCTRAARACPRTSPGTATSTGRTSCSGTRSGSRTSRAPRTGRSCRWTTPGS